MVLTKVTFTAVIVAASLAADSAVLAQGTRGSRQLSANTELLAEACSEDGLLEDINECKTLCSGTACCFDESCSTVMGEDCSVFAACHVMVEGSMNAVNGDEPAVYVATDLPTNPPEEDDGFIASGDEAEE